MSRALITCVFLILASGSAFAGKCSDELKPKTLKGEKIMATKTASEVIEALGLQPLPGEGGFFRETYRSPETMTVTFKGDKQPVVRNLSTQILYLVTESSSSALHRLKQDEIFHFYDGLAAEILLIFPDKTSKLVRLGKDISSGEVLQLTITAGTWQGVRLPEGKTGYSLMGTSVTPGFDFADFELGQRDQLIQQMPELKALIEKYTRAE